MFGFLRKKKELSLLALTDCKVVPIEQVPDPVFSEKIIGDGIAFMPEDGVIKSPCTGEVVQIFPTKHAIGLRTEEGLEILIHLGLDTVELKGEGFEAYVEADDSVEAGQELVHMDLEYVESQGKSIMCVMVIVNMDDKVKDLHVTREEYLKTGCPFLKVRFL